MQFIYVISTSGPSVYADMTALSASLLRFIHPNAEIIVFADQDSMDVFKTINHLLLHLNVNLKPVSVTSKTPTERSREIRIRLRELVTGDFVYLDNDTLPVRDLSELFSVPHNFAAAENHSTHIGWNFIKSDLEKFDQLGWKKPDRHFINAGVSFWRDTPQTHRLSKIYMGKWQESKLKTGQALDQPALNAALVEWGEPYTLLDNRFNAQIIPNINTAIDSNLYHLYSSGTDYIPTWMSTGLFLLQKTGTIPVDWVQQVIKARTPFVTRSDWHEQRLIKGIRRRGYQFNLISYYFTQDQYGKIGLHYFSRLRKKLI